VRARNLRPRRLAAGDPLGHRQMRHCQGAHIFDALAGGRVALDVVVVISSPIFGARALTSTRLHATRGGT
jgi:hypothetical protein